MAEEHHDKIEFVWPWWIRLIHALTAITVLGLWLMAYQFLETGYWHRCVGYVLLSMLVFRLLMHVCLPMHSGRFYWPNYLDLTKHLRSVKSGILKRDNQPIYLSQHANCGHNPLGQLAVYLMYLLIALLAFTGWLSRTDAYWGEDAPIIFHQYCSYALMALVILHLLAVILMSRLQKINLVKRMWHL